MRFQVHVHTRTVSVILYTVCCCDRAVTHAARPQDPVVLLLIVLSSRPTNVYFKIVFSLRMFAFRTRPNDTRFQTKYAVAKNIKRSMSVQRYFRGLLYSRRNSRMRLIHTPIQRFSTNVLQ